MAVSSNVISMWPIGGIPSAFDQLAASRYSPTSQPGRKSHHFDSMIFPLRCPFYVIYIYIGDLTARFDCRKVNGGCWFQIRLWICVDLLHLQGRKHHRIPDPASHDAAWWQMASSMGLWAHGPFAKPNILSRSRRHHHRRRRRHHHRHRRRPPPHHHHNHNHNHHHIITIIITIIFRWEKSTNSPTLA